MKQQRGIFKKVPGSSEWWIRFADATGRIRREKVGTFEEAETRLRLRKQEAKLGVLPKLAWRSRPVLFSKIAKDALGYADQHKRSAGDDHIRMEKLLTWFGERTADSIGPRDIEAHFQAEKWAAATWNRYRALLPLNAAALRALLDLHRLHGKGEFVCGGITSPRYWFEAAIVDAKIEEFTWHCLRHTFASRLVMSGADLRTVAELLRDRTLAMVMRYAHLGPDQKLAAVERMAASFPDSKTDTKLTPTFKPQEGESSLMQ